MPNSVPALTEPRSPPLSAAPSHSAEPWGSNVLLVEDNPGDAKLVERMLGRAQDAYHVHHVRRLDEAVDALQTQDFSLVLLDLSLPDGGGLETVREVNGAAPSAPIVVLSGLADQTVALEALQAGAQDFLTKGGVGESELLRSMRFAMERKRAETRLTYLAHHDQLTGLVNRASLRERLGRALNRAERGERRVALLFMDLDRFKQINDTFGHEVGDRLLLDFAHRLRSCARPGDTMGRLGGDEFALVVENVETGEAAEEVARAILHALKDPFALGAVTQRVTTSIGIAISTPGDDVETLLERADEAMYRAKRAGRGTYSLSEPGGRAGTFTADEVEQALDGNQLELLYQPKLDLTSGRVMGVEAFIRWNHPRRGELSPTALIPLLQDTGLMVPVGDWILRRACQQARRWGPARRWADLDRDPTMDVGSPGFRPPRPPDGVAFRLAVNIAQEQFDQEGLGDAVADVLAQTGFPAESLELEVTEEVILRNVVRSREVLGHLRSLGVRISLDDFNARSSLTDLTQFPLDIIKLDRTLISELEKAPARRAIISAVVNLAANLGIETVAEGVETPAEAACVRSLGCGAIQGYYLCGPMDAVGFTVWLAGHEADV